MSSSTSNVLCLPLNRVGRDFVVGDLGGEFGLVFQAMRDAGFDPARDRLISVGHLLAGVGTLTDCIRFLRTPSVYAVRSNSEQDLLDLFADGPPDEESIQALSELDFHSMVWLAEAGQLQRAQLVNSMRMLPLAISIGDTGASVGFVHGAAVGGTSWVQFLAGLHQGADDCVAAAVRGGGDAAAGYVDGVERVFVCYTPDWELSDRLTNTIAVAPGPVLQLVKDMMAPPKLVHSRKVLPT